MGTVTQDFEFVKHSEAYARFLLAAHAEGLAINEAARFHPFKGTSVFISVDAPEHIAMILKLTFAGELRHRAAPSDDEHLREGVLVKIKELSMKHPIKLVKYKAEPSYYDIDSAPYFNMVKLKSRFPDEDL